MTTFGHLLQIIISAENRVSKMRQSFDCNPTNSLRDQLLLARTKLHEALKAQEIHWKQKSRVSWLREGD